MRALSLCAAAFAWAAPVAALVAGPAAVIALLAAGSRPLAFALAFVLMPVVAGALAIVHVRERRETTPARPGVPVPGEPDIARLVCAAAAAVGVAEPAVVRITLGSGVALARERGEPVLTIGACWLTASSRGELTVAVAHALALHRAGSGSRSARVLDGQLWRAGNLVADGRMWRLLWGGYARVGIRLRGRARARRRRWADLACARAFGLESLDAYLRAAFRQERFDAYWEGDVEPCLSDGFAPPILAGWDAVLAQPWFRESLADDLAAARLTLRSEAVRAWAAHAPAPAGQAIVLTTPVGRLERDLLAATYPDTQPGALVDIDWDAVGNAVWLPRLHRHAARLGGAIAPFAVRDLGAAIASAEPDADESPERAIAALLAIALVEAGWALDVHGGGEIELRHGELLLRPVSLCLAAASGALDGAGWLAFVDEAGIGDVVVGPARAQPGASPSQPDTDAWSPQATPPPRGAVQLELARSPHRVRSTIYLAIVTVLGLPAGIAMIIVASYAPTAAGTIVGGVLGVGTLAALGAVLKVGVPVVHARGTLTISADRIRIEHAGLLKEPFELGHGSIRAVLIDDTVPGTARFAVTASAFPVVGAESATFLWIRDEEEAVVPCLAAPSQDPNLALLLEQPVLGPRVRRATLTGPLPGEALTGLLLCVADADAARAAFRPWDLMRPALLTDVAHLYHGFTGRSPDPSASSPTE